MRTIFKLGGSLLDQHDWPSRLREWLGQQPLGEYFGIVGGGDLIEAMRKLDRIHTLSQHDVHWRCIRLLDMTFEIAAELTPDFGRVEKPEQIATLRTPYAPALTRSSHTWVRVGCFYSPELRFDGLVPAENWSTTTDTLAIFLGGLLKAERCVLLKSCETDDIVSLDQAVELGVVDEECPRFRELVPQIELHRL